MFLHFQPPSAFLLPCKPYACYILYIWVFISEAVTFPSRCFLKYYLFSWTSIPQALKKPHNCLLPSCFKWRLIFKCWFKFSMHGGKNLFKASIVLKVRLNLPLNFVYYIPYSFICLIVVIRNDENWF